MTALPATLGPYQVSRSAFAYETATTVLAAGPNTPSNPLQELRCASSRAGCLGEPRRPGPSETFF
ncbi:MAG: hypothetical protein NVS3B6_21000 [Pseudarthrobacter sp.]